MKDDLRKDLLAIVLEEAFGMQEHYARDLAIGLRAKDKRHRKADEDAMEAAHHIVNRIDARCSKIEG